MTEIDTASAVIPLATTIISALFAALVMKQFFGRRKLHQLVWTCGLILFSLASFCEFLSEIWNWNVTMYKLYYAMAPTVVAILGLGTVYLLGNKRFGHGFLLYILIVFFTFLFFVTVADVDTNQFERGTIVAGKAMPSTVRIFSPLLTIPGSIALIGGALYSWYVTKESFNLLIALGAIVIAGGGSLARFEISELLYITALIGICIMFVGFIKSEEVIRKAE